MKSKAKVILSIVIVCVFLLGAVLGYLNKYNRAKELERSMSLGTSPLPATVGPPDEQTQETSTEALTVLQTDEATEE